ncbi:MAG TPA: DUF6485 family protein [Spirochaetales bacterium]|nr:DUF6485 family protein [Spirochaetales bacterium]HRV29125.1 DUF6485 family protein [Spirochaetia bacterium]
MEPCIVTENKKRCNCTYPCEKHGKCCECIAYHRSNGELPACYFNKEAEKTYNRSIAYYISLQK